MCASVCARARGKKELRDIEAIFKKVKCIYVCARARGGGKKEKKKNKLDFQRKRELSGRKEEKIQARENFSI